MNDIRLQEAKRVIRELQQRLNRVALAHKQGEEGAGMMSGYCVECEHVWPCLTWHLAKQLTEQDYRRCWKQRYCEHAGVRL